MNDVTQVLAAMGAGDPQAAERLLPLVYDELRKLAAARMAAERPDHTLQATALVHEAYLRLVDQEQAAQWKSRGHFFAAAAEAMRRILVERARTHRRRQQALDEVPGLPAPSAGSILDDVLSVDEALSKFELQHPEIAAVVKLRYFAGLTLAEAAALLDISEATADRRWKYARAWLSRELRGT